MLVRTGVQSRLISDLPQIRAFGRVRYPRRVLFYNTLTTMIGKCKSCEKQFKYSPSQQSGEYCSNKCHKDYTYNKNINDWLCKKITGRKRDGRPSDFVRRYLLEESNYKCTECGWGKPNPINGIIYLEIDHIDGIRENSYRENLRVLYPNCHTLTDTYKTLNKNIGYHKKRKTNK
jgi:5-methylcytosine-specific restriction endonuclease McrA